jgi:hypothetical protein
MVATRQGRSGDHGGALELVHETDERPVDLEEVYDAVTRLLLRVHQRRGSDEVRAS